MKFGVDNYGIFLYNNDCLAGMAELADAYGSGPYGSNTMRVQVSFPAYTMSIIL